MHLSPVAPALSAGLGWTTKGAPARSISSLVVFGVAAASCATVPSAPGGPLQQSGVIQFSETQIFDVSRINIETDKGQRQGFAADAGGCCMVPFRLGGRVAATDWIDVAGDWGLNDSGTELRAGLAEGMYPLPLAFLIGARTDALAPAAGRRVTGHQNEIRLRFEAYPALRSPSATSPTRMHLVLALGGSHGRHYHAFNVVDKASLEREEDRIEGALGIDLRRGRFVGQVIAMPYFVAHASAPTSLECEFGDCITARVLEYQQAFGVSIVLSLGIALRQHPPHDP